jgi:hypothetical protein
VANSKRFFVGLPAWLCLLAAGTGRADVELGGLVLQHDYFLGHLTDLTGNGRDGVLGSSATLVPPSGGESGYINLPGGSSATSHVTFPTLSGGKTLAQLSEANGGDLTLEFWFDFDSSNAFGTDDGQSRFNLFGGTSSEGSDSRLTFDFRQPSSSEHDVGGSKDSDIINGAYRGGDARRSSVEGLHQWVYVMDGNYPTGDGTWQIYRDGQPMTGTSFGGGLSRNEYKSQTASFLSLAGSPNKFTIGGEADTAAFGGDPTGKLYRTLIYDQALNATQVGNNFSHGLNTFGPPPPAPKQVTLLTSGGNAPDTRYMQLNIEGDLELRPFTGIATWIANPSGVRLEQGRLQRIPSDAGDVGQVVMRRINIPDSVVEPAIEDLQAMPASDQLNKNFVHIYMGNQAEVMDWFDDSWWSNISHNIGQIARVAKEGGLEGILIDPEMYSYTLWGYNQLKDPGAPAVPGSLPEIYGDKSFAQVEAMVRQRGQEFGAAINAEYPDSTIMFFHAGSYAAKQIFHDPYGRWPNTEESPFGLIVPFVDGILESTSDGTKVVDANSWTHQPKGADEFQFGEDLVRTKAKSLSAVPELYAAKVQVGHAIRTSYGPGEGNSPGGQFDPDNPDSNYYSPAALEDAVSDALEYGDGYVLFWEGLVNWWLDSPSALPVGGAPHSPNSKYIDPVYWEALANAAAPYMIEPANPLLGDFNNDGSVDAADYPLWRDSLGLAITLPNEDPNVTPGAVTYEDYDVWKSNFGNTLANSPQEGSAAVPEPAGLVLIIIGAIAISTRCYRRTILLG